MLLENTEVYQFVMLTILPTERGREVMPTAAPHSTGLVCQRCWYWRYRWYVSLGHCVFFLRCGVSNDVVVNVVDNIMVTVIVAMT